MREIKKVNLAAMQQIQDSKAMKADKADLAFCAASEDAPVQDFSNPKAESLGRSQVSKTDNIKTDVAFGIANPDAIASADRFFDNAYAQLQKEGEANAYEKACGMTDAYVKEFHK